MDATDVSLSQVTPSSALTQKLRMSSLQIKFVESLPLSCMLFWLLIVQNSYIIIIEKPTTCSVYFTAYLRFVINQ